MALADLWAWLETLPLAEQIGATWWFPLLESFHVLSSTFIVGSILMVDLRLLSLAGTKYRSPGSSGKSSRGPTPPARCR